MLGQTIRKRGNLTMSTNKFSRLNLDIDNMEELIKFWSEQNLDSVTGINRINKENRVSFIIEDGQGDIQIDFIECTGKRYTISSKVGKQQQKSQCIAEYILDSINNASSSKTEIGNGFSIVTNLETFQNVVSLLETDDEIICMEKKRFDEPHKAVYWQYRFKSQYGDQVVLKYFDKSSRLQMQGKPLYLFGVIQDILISDKETVEGIVDANIKYYSIDMKKEDLYIEMKEKLGEDLYDFLTSSLRAILSPAFLLYKVEMDIGNYSCLCQPALQALEGYTLKLLTASGVVHNDENLGAYYDYDEKTNKHKLNGDTCDIVKDENKITSLNMLYALYKSKRHVYSHSTERNWDTNIITDRETADSIFREVIAAMRSSYENWK